MRIRRRQVKANAWQPGLTWLMATTAMVHFSVYAPQSASAIEPNTEEDLARKRFGLPDRKDRDPYTPNRDDRWVLSDPPSRGFRPARQMVVAQSNDNTSKEFDFDIQPQPLASALHRFGEQAGVQFAYATEDVENVRTGGVAGRRTSDEALRLLLLGTGLDYRFTGKIVTLEKSAVSMTPATNMGTGAAIREDQPSGKRLTEEPPPTKPVKVPEVVVKETKTRAPVVDSPDGYKADVSSEAVLRFPASIQELPQSVSVITKDSIRERRAVTQLEALEGVAGISNTTQLGGLSSDNFVLRGFEMQFNTPGYNRDNGLSAFNNYVSDPTLYDRIEVIKGPASFTSGFVSAGGFVNRLLKAPLDRNFVLGEAGVGSAGHYRTTLDANGVMPNLPVAGRFVFAHNEDPEFFRNTGNQRFSFLPSVRFAPREDFTVTITGNVQRLRGKGNVGTPTTSQGLIPAAIEDSFLGDDNRLKLDYQSIHVEAEKKFVQGIRLKAKGQYSKDETRYQYAFGIQPGGIGPSGDVNIYGFGGLFKRNSWAGEVNLTKDFSLFGNLSSVAAGIDYNIGHQNINFGDFLSFGTANIANPRINAPLPPGFLDNFPSFYQDMRFNQTGAFAQGLLRPFAGTTFMVALRGNWITQEAEAAFTGGAGSIQRLNQSRLTPQIGLSQRLMEGLNVYASYSESIQPNFATTRDGSLLDPMTGQMVEVGSKWEPLGGRMRLTAALFRMELDNVASADPAFPPNSGISIGGQSQRNQGFEFEARGALLPQLQVSLAYTFLDTEFTKSTIPEFVGARAFNSPAHTVSVFGSYDLSQVLTKGLKLGAVVYYKSDVSSFPPNFQNQIFDGYTRADLFAIYAPLPWLSFQVNLNNLADARYIQGPNRYDAFNQFGPPRHVIGMVRMTF